MNLLLRTAIHAAYYPSVWFNRLMCGVGLWRQWDAVDEWVLFGAVPSEAQIGELRGLGVGAIVNMCEEFAGHTRAMESCGIEQLRLPTLDYHSPSEADLVRGIDFIARQITSGHRIFIHCKAGRGRAPTMALCYLMARQGISAAQAYAMLREARPHLTRRLDRRPSVMAVEQLVCDGSISANRG
jgi:atypical dual specificity phosphatase